MLESLEVVLEEYGDTDRPCFSLLGIEICKRGQILPPETDT